MKNQETMTNSLLSQFKPAKKSETIIISTKEEMINVQKRAMRPTYTNCAMVSTNEFMDVILEGYNDDFSDCICKISKDVWNSIDVRKFSNFLLEQLATNQEKCYNNPNLK